jgi:hypothetical protein
MKRLIIPAVLALATTRAQAAITQDVSTTAGVLNAYTVSNTDLLQLPGTTGSSSGYSAFTSGGFTFGLPETVLRDGNAGPNNTTNTGWSIQAFEGTNQNPQYTVTFTLDLTNAANGYDLTSIAAFTGWTDRAAQTFNIYYSTVGSSSFIKLNSGNTVGGALDAFGDTSIINGSIRTTVTDTAGMIAGNVDEIRFEMLPTAANGSVYREIDVIGVASVPEPSTYGLIGAGSLALAAFVRRRRASKR